jgi:hypothetical protein
VLTDGSGRKGPSRLSSTERVLRDVGAETGAVFGRFTDVELYRALLDGRVEPFLRVADELADAFVGRRVWCVTSDAREDYNPAHDLCHVVTAAALLLARRRGAGAIRHLDVSLVDRPDDCPESARKGALTVQLDDREFERKRDAAARYPELAHEVDLAVGWVGSTPFRTECLRPVQDVPLDRPPAHTPPYYETYGEMLVAAGEYDRVLRYREHFAPAAAAIRRHVEGAAGDRTIEA